MRLTSKEDPRTGDKLLCLRIEQSDMVNAERTGMDQVFLDYLKDKPGISYTLLAAAIIAREVERGYENRKNKGKGIKTC